MRDRQKRFIGWIICLKRLNQPNLDFEHSFSINFVSYLPMVECLEICPQESNAAWRSVVLLFNLSMNQHNIGEAKTSVKVNNNPGGKSNWSLYWNEPEKNAPKKPSNIIKYHNESNFELGSPDLKDQEEEKRRLEEEERKKKEEELNSKLPGYDPRNGGKASIHFGDEKTDYRKKEEVFTSVKVKNPPGGKSSIQFG